jgi:hypothetical protein
MVKTNGRFLGWNYAARSGQDTSRWQRQLREKPQIARVGSARTRAKAAIKPAAGFGPVGFNFRGQLPTGFIPTAVVEGDFNQDGHMDVAISNGGDNSIYVLLGNGDGTFQVPEILYTSGQSPDWITAVSLRNNGHLDLAVTDGDSNIVEIFLGKGDGTFQPGVPVSLPQTPSFVLAGDFNNDGNADLAIGLVVDAGSTEPQFEILLGNGSGGFSGTLLAPPILAGEDPIPTGWIAAGDVNNDGWTDLVATVTGVFAHTYLNQGGSGFSQGAAFGPLDSPMVVGLGDMNEDGCLDAVELGGYGLLTIAKGTCDGNFTQGPAIAGVGDLDPAVKVVDVDGDGHLDVVGSSAFYGLGQLGYGNEGGYLVSVFKGDGHGNVSVAKTYRGGTDAYSLVVTDFNGDNKPEILTISSMENDAGLFINDGTGKYDGPQGESIWFAEGRANVPFANFPPMKVADLNGDGHPDLYLVEDGLNNATHPCQLTAMLNDGAGNFLPPLRTPITVGPTSPYPLFIAGAFRSATMPDIIYLNQFYAPNVVAFFPGNGNGTFGSPTTLATLPDPLQIATGDFNGDGKLDFVVYGTDGGNPANQEIDVFLGHGDGSFTELAPATFPVISAGSAEQLFAVDLNYDGKLDLLIGNNINGGWTDTGDDLILALGNGDGTFQTPKILMPHFGAVALADVNQDGYLDLIQGRDPNFNVGQSLFQQPGITVYLGAANGTFTQQPSYDLPGLTAPTMNPVLVGDFNGDGIPDIAFRYFGNISAATIEDRLRLLQGVGDGTFTPAGHTYQLQTQSDPFVGADFTGAGTTDLVELVGYSSSFHTISPAAGPALDIALDSNPIIGTTDTATITLDLPAAATENVTLSASDPAIQIPPSAQFNAGQQSQNISFTIGSGFDATHVLALYATMGSSTAVAYGSKPNPNLNVGASASLLSGIYPLEGSIDITANESFPLTLELTSEGGYTSTFSSFQCSGLPPGASCTFANTPITLFPGRQGGVSFEVATSPSTPQGTYSVQVSATDGFVQSAATFAVGIGDFSLAISPPIIVIGQNGSVFATVTSTSTNGLAETINFTCGGLPAQVACGQQSLLNANGGQTNNLGLGDGRMTANDYPFQITGTADVVSHTANAILRVGDFTASLDKTTATLSAGQSATFTVTLTSLNHYASSITVFCQSPSNSVICPSSPSPVILTDGGSATAQLTLQVPSSASAMLGPSGRSADRTYLLLFLLPLSLLLVHRKATPGLLRIVVVGTALAVAVSCGGGSGGTGGNGGAGGNGGGNPPPITVTIPVFAEAAVTPGDNNQKTLTPIVITVK